MVTTTWQSFSKVNVSYVPNIISLMETNFNDTYKKNQEQNFVSYFEGYLHYGKYLHVEFHLEK